VLASPAAAVPLAAGAATMIATPVAEPNPTVALPTTGPVDRTELVAPSPPPPVRSAPPLPAAEPEGRTPRTGLFIGLSVGLLAVLLVLLFLLARLLGFGGGEGGGNQVAVDNVVDKTFTEADALLRSRGFVVTREDRTDDSVPTGTVIEQEPSGGSQVEKGSPVKLVVALATGKIQVPGLVNLKQDEAEAAVKAAGLVPVVEFVKNTSVSDGFVFEQNPAPNALVDKGGKVTIRVSSGDGLPPVPDVVNLPVLEATNRLTSAGFQTRDVEENSPSVPAGIVTRTDPPGGAKLTRGETRVTIFVSRGAPTTTVGKVAVPSVSGVDEATARSRLTSAGFTVQVQSTPGGTPGRVKSQSPAAGARIDAGSTVTIVVGAAATTTSSSTTTTTVRPTTSSSTAVTI